MKNEYEKYDRKVVCIKSDDDNLLSVGKCYIAKIWSVYDPNTFSPVRKYRIDHHDGFFKSYPVDMFITVEEYRKIRLDELGI